MSEWDDLVKALERERLRLVSPHKPQRDRNVLRSDPDPQGKSRLDEATREMWGEK